MKQEQFDIKFVRKWPEDEIVNLYKAGGWWKDDYDKSAIKYLIKGSFVFAVAIYKKTGKTIGMGRVLSDAYIQDLVILSEYRSKGIGKKIVKKLISYCRSKNIHWIALIAEPNQEGFYENIGFKQMKNYTPMKYGDK
jgi:ribosomal protein S18 acetylase RimI-like enzyme